MFNRTLQERQFPPFPENIIEGLVEEFVRLYGPLREVPDPFLWLAFATYFGNAMSQYRSLDCASSEPRLFGVAVGSSGKTKKSTGNNLARDFFKQVQNKDVPQLVIEGFGSAEGLLRRLAENKNAPALVHLDEMNILASKTDIRGSLGIGFIHKFFEDHDYDHDLSNGDRSIKNAYLSMLGASTLEDYTRIWGSSHEDAGSFSRFLVVGCDESGKVVPRPLNPSQRLVDALVEKTAGVIQEIRRKKSEISTDASAERLWQEFYHGIGTEKEWNRIDTYGFRLMAIQSALRGENSVTKSVVQNVIEFLQYEVATRKLVSPVVAKHAGAEMEEIIRKFLPVFGTWISHRELSRRTNSHRHGIEVFKRAINNLYNEGEIDKKERGKSLIYTRLMPESEIVINSSDDTETEVSTNRINLSEVFSINRHQSSTLQTD